MKMWDEVTEILNLLKEPWLWIIILSLDAILIGPFIILWFVLSLPPQLRLLAMVLIIILWGIVSGVKDWIISKRKEEKMKRRT